MTAPDVRQDPRHRQPPRRPLPGWWSLRWQRVVQLWAVGLGASLLVTGASALGYLEAFQARSFDLLLRLQGQRLAPEAVVVAIDEAAFEAMGRRQPMSRAYLARVIRGLARAGAAAAALDVALSDPTTPEEDGALVEAILGFSDRGVSRVVLVDGPAPGTGPLADPRLAEGAMRAAAEVPVDQDGVIRRMTLLVPRPGGRQVPALSLAVGARLAGLSPRALSERLGPEGGLVPVPLWRAGGGWDTEGAPPVQARPGEVLRINFVGPAGSFLTIPADAVAALADPGAAVAQDNPLRGRVALVGGTFADSRDSFQTPHGLIPGVEVHANLVHMLLRRSFIRPTGFLVSLGIQAGFVLLAGLVMARLRPLGGTLLCLAGAVLLGVPASTLAFQRSGYWADFLLPVLVTCLLGVGAEGLARRRIRGAFGRHVSPEVAARILADAPDLRGERREVSILFSDLRGFTTLSETMPAEEVAARLNEYFDAMGRAIFAYRGMVNDFVGDGIVAFFGAPLADPRHALHAVQAAAAMDRALAELNARWQAAGLPTVRMGIGVHTGQVFVGNIGGAARVKYTVVGDPVNLASRVEGLNKDLGTAILITEETWRAVADRVEVKDRGVMPIRGRAEPVRVFELLAVRQDADARPAGPGGQGGRP